MQFDGATTVYDKDLTGVDSDQLLLHLWFNWGHDTAAANEYLFAVLDDFALRLTTSERLHFVVEDAGGVDVVAISPTDTFSTLSGWTAIDIVIDTTQTFAKVYINGVLKASQIPTINDMKLSLNNYAVGGRASGTSHYTGDIHQLAMWNSFSADYVSATGELTAKYFAEMYDLDSDGVIYPKETSIASVTGGQPLILLENEYSTFNESNGSEGDFAGFSGASATPLPESKALPYGNWAFTP